MASGATNYLKAAFANVYNLSLLGGAMTVSVATGDWGIGAVALGLEALWLLIAPDTAPFRRVADRWGRLERDDADRKRSEALMSVLPQREWTRAKAIDELRREIERDMTQNPSFQAFLLQTEIDKLAQLHRSFVDLATACVRAETYLSATNPSDLHRQIDVQRGVEKSVKDPEARQIAGRNIEVLQKRLETIEEIQNFLARARGQMSLIENSVRLLRDQVLTMASPDQLHEQLDDLITGVDAVQASAKEHEAIFSKIDVTPVVPVAMETEGAKVPGQRVR